MTRIPAVFLRWAGQQLGRKPTPDAQNRPQNDREPSGGGFVAPTPDRAAGSSTRVYQLAPTDCDHPEHWVDHTLCGDLRCYQCGALGKSARNGDQWEAT